MRGKRFYKHEVQVFERKRVPDGYGGTIMQDVITDTPKVFIDTPTSKEQFYSNQMNEEKFQRFMYYPYGLTFTRGMRLKTEEEGEIVTYEVVGKPENQGNQNQVMRAMLKEVKVTT